MGFESLDPTERRRFFLFLYMYNSLAVAEKLDRSASSQGFDCNSGYCNDPIPQKNQGFRSHKPCTYCMLDVRAPCFFFVLARGGGCLNIIRAFNRSRFRVVLPTQFAAFASSSRRPPALVSGRVF